MKHSVRPATRAGRTRTGAGSDEAFDVLVLATMSAGKTSVINALIGQELLHSANEATTACMTSVEHRQGARHFTGACYSHADQELARQQNTSPTVIRDWNANSAVKRISLSGSFKVVPSPAPGLMLHDTPGPNNSQNERHAELMLEALRTISCKALCYVLNASQLGTQDDRALLEQLREELAGRVGVSTYFILNKVDLLDPEHGETIGTYVDKAQRYLADIGFERPIIIPTKANVALYARKALRAEPLTRSQRLKLRQALDELEDDKHALLDACVVPKTVKQSVFKTLTNLERQRAKPLDERAVQRNELQQLVAISGLKTVEALIKHQRQTIKKP